MMNHPLFRSACVLRRRLAAALLVATLPACDSRGLAPIEDARSTYILTQYDGLTLEEFSETGHYCRGILAGRLDFTRNRGAGGTVIVTHVLGRSSGTVAVVDTASFEQLGHAVRILFRSTTGRTRVALFLGGESAALETKDVSCYPGEQGAARDIAKRLRYERAR